MKRVALRDVIQNYRGNRLGMALLVEACIEWRMR